MGRRGGDESGENERKEKMKKVEEGSEKCRRKYGEVKRKKRKGVQ